MFQHFPNMRGGERVSEFGKWIRQKRNALGLTQTECAERAGMKVQQWSRMEKEVTRPAYDTLVAVAKALQLPLEEVLIAASYEVYRPEAVESRIGKRLEPLLLQVPSDRRPAIEAAIEQVTRAMVGAATA